MKGVGEVCAHHWLDYGEVNVSWCHKCEAQAVTGYEDRPFIAPPSAPVGVEAFEDALTEYVEDYEFHGEDDTWREGYYTPNERERMLIEDALRGWEAERPESLAQQPAPSAPVGVEGLMQLAREWCLSWGEWAHDNDPDCKKENAAEAALRAALTAALAQQPAACSACNDRREVGGATQEGFETHPCPECAQQPAADAEWIKHPQTIEAKAQWDAVAQALGADPDCPNAVLAAAQAKPAAVDGVWHVQLADALECFWNPAIEGSGDDRSNIIGGMVQGFAAVAYRLREHAALAAQQPTTNGPASDTPNTDARNPTC